ncbi:hypothetical protein PRIPAC_94008 [Pristionchus pacificus]|uniref:Uncharacterized protein n=1 Tax=Pristionchus pacificus TaxID=54126 RepID=A0A2A6BBR7_PRIPA|nr:hypothetical protein PRIPAC_94008 [Pristionchus pacificus]|eukprot:PDM63325.1 hypothetical protein PRIPAC_50540 [Pristionchus pacificus]
MSEHICCSRPLQCPPGLAALREKSVPRVCTIGVPGTCPPDHLCVRGVGEPLANDYGGGCCRCCESVLQTGRDVCFPRPNVSGFHVPGKEKRGKQ